MAYRLLTMKCSIFTICALWFIFIVAVAGQVPPRWQWQPERLIEAFEGAIFDLHCPAIGSPNPLIEWSFNSVPFHRLAEGHRRLLLDRGRILRIPDPNHDLDTGTWNCNASNPFGHTSLTMYADVKAFAPRFKMPSHRIWKIIRGSTIDMNCDVEASPLPAVRWVNANDSEIVPVPGKFEMLSNSTLRIIDTSPVDDGYYYCNVSNIYGINRALNKIETYNPSYFTQIPGPGPITLGAFDSLELKCQARVDSKLRVNYIWSKNGKVIDVEPTLSESGVSTLRLPSVRGHHSGTIECAAVTDVDVKISGIQVLVKDIPDPPEMQKVDCSMEQYALVVWRRPNEHGSLIQTFTIEVNTGFDKNWIAVHEERNIQDKKLFKAAIPLSPWVNYTLRMYAHNSFGSSLPAYEPNDSPPCSTTSDVPYKNPTDVKAFGTEPESLKIQWKPLERMEWNAPGLHYMVRYRIWPDSEDSPSAEWNEFFIEDPFANETVIRELPIFQRYQVEVHAVNSKGFSAVPAKTVFGFSGENVPLEAPTGVHLVSRMNYSTVRVGWNPVDPKLIRGHFRGFKIVYWPTDRPILVQTHYVGNGTVEAEVGGMDAMRNYTLEVYVLNWQYQSPSSEPFYFETSEGAPSRVHNLRVHAVGAHSAFLTWEPPLRPNGNIRGYFIAFENPPDGYSDETYVLHRQHYYLNELLKPNSPYTISVWAETKGGEGLRTIRSTRTWPLGKPEKPIFAVHSLSTQTFGIEWRPRNNVSSSWRFSGTSFYINYTKMASETIGSSNGWIQSRVITLPDTVLFLRGLEEGTDYKVIGVALEGTTGLYSTSGPFQVRTESETSSPKINPDRLRSAAWFIVVLCCSALTLAIIVVMCLLAQRKNSLIYSIRAREKRFSHSLSSEYVYYGDLQDRHSMSDEHERFLTTGQYRRMVTTSRLRKGLPAPPSEVWDKRDKLPLAALKEDDLLEQLEERRNGQEQGAVPIKPIVADDD